MYFSVVISVKDKFQMEKNKMKTTERRMQSKMEEEMQNQFLSGCLLKLINGAHAVIMMQGTNDNGIPFHLEYDYDYYSE